jgi:DNA polymerase-3 subunit gamma/tau
MEVFAEAEMRIRDAASKKILAEVALLKAIEARSAVGVDALLKQLQDLRDGQGGGSASVPGRPAVPSAKPTGAAVAVSQSTPAPRAAVTAAAAVAEQPPGDLTELWAALVEAVGRASPFTRTYLLEAHPVSFQKNVFTIGFDPEVQDHLGLVDNARNHALLQTKLAELGHPNTQIKFIKAEAPAAPTAPLGQPAAPAPVPAATAAPKPAAAKAAAPIKEKLAPVPFNRDDFKNDPLIQKALEIFKGQIVEVRA